ncbi:uncharacterized protein [Euphorbia lathyris]|uniref:uncharacterized protein n=1 Tax=Euphorbia lathyris TaxID=212925 RepID=UPI0033130D8C
MQPRFNSAPSQFPNQNQSNGTNPPFQSQGFSANPALPNLCNVLQSSMPLQPQLGAFNPQFPLPFNNSSFPMPNMAALIAQQPALMNQLGMALQNHSNNMNTVPMFMNQLNSCQPQGQPFAVNFPNFPQQFNQNMAFANLQNLMHNLNPVMPTQMANPSQFVSPHPQNPNFFPNPPFAAGRQEANTNQQNFVEEKKINQMPQNQNSRHSAPFRNQGKPVNNGQNSSLPSNSNNFPRNGFRKNMKHQKSQFPHSNNGKRKFGISNEHKGTGSSSERAAKSGRTDSTEQAGERKRSYAVTYTEQEIKLWREERKKNHPSNATIKKKHTETITNSEVISEEAKLRREQLKEILAKQAELGVEVAEVPSHYLCESEKQVNHREDNRNSFGKSRNSWNKNDKRGRRNKRDRFGKKKTSANKDPLTMSPFNKKEQTLLQKLLSADAKRDKLRLLQVFRFMVVNKFFDGFPEKTLEFPQIIVKEEEKESGKSQVSGKDFSKIGNKKTVENVGDAKVEREMCYGEVVEENKRIVEEEEEGEIIN